MPCAQPQVDLLGGRVRMQCGNQTMYQRFFGGNSGCTYDLSGVTLENGGSLEMHKDAFTVRLGGGSIKRKQKKTKTKKTKRSKKSNSRRRYWNFSFKTRSNHIMVHIPEFSSSCIPPWRALAFSRILGVWICWMSRWRLTLPCIAWTKRSPLWKWSLSHFFTFVGIFFVPISTQKTSEYNCMSFRNSGVLP